MSIIQLRTQPSRDELRAALTVLNQRANAGDMQAEAELQAVRMFSRLLYPRKAENRRSARLIEAADSEYPCPHCHGSRGRLIAIDAVTGLHTANLLSCGDEPDGSIPVFRLCACCGGRGRFYGTAEVREAGVGRDRFQPAYSGPVARRQRVGRLHNRGFCCGRFVRRPPRGDVPRFLQLWPRQHGEGFEQSGWSELDLSACMEGHAVAMRRLGAQYVPRNQRKFGSGRDKTLLTPHQERRSKMARRARRYQSEHNRQHPPTVTKRGEATVKRMARRLGIDVDALLASMQVQPPVPEYDAAIVAEARRRCDLPPLDEPTVDESPSIESAPCLRCGRRDCGVTCPPIHVNTPSAV
jgi:hypothetical protein